MVALLARWRRCRWWWRSHTILVVCAFAVATVLWALMSPTVLDSFEREKVKSYIDNQLYETIMQEKGIRRHCEFPNLDPFAKEMTRFNIDKKITKITCPGRDWVKCYHSKCRVVDSIKETFTDIKCKFRDILYQGDFNYTIGPPRESGGDEVHELIRSDHAKVSCVGRRKHGYFKTGSWSGNVVGFRPTTPAWVPPGREPYNVLMFGFDSTSRNGFIRDMPNSWKVLNDMGFTVMEGYNIVGDGTPAALFPFLTGKTELELPDVRRSERNHRSMDDFPFIFHKLKENGYRTAFFEDSPDIGTFQYRLNGFRRQPADHYLRALLLDEDERRKWSLWKISDRHCLGDTPQYKVIINLTQQFLALGGKRFIFTFVADITHEEPMIHVADDDTAAFLQSLQVYLEDTLVIVLSDHGPRFSEVRDSLQGKLEERLPLLAIRLPSRLARARARAQRALRANAHALSTPHDVHATVLDVLGMRQLWSPFRVRGAELTRGLTMLEPIPHTRSCSEAGIEPHWCTCLSWKNVSSKDPFYQRPAVALVDYINSLVAEVGDLCIPRTLKSTAWLLRLNANERLLSFARSRDIDGYVGHFVANTRGATENYQTKVHMSQRYVLDTYCRAMCFCENTNSRLLLFARMRTLDARFVNNTDVKYK